MIYILTVLLPPLGLLLNGQPFSAILSVILIVFCLIFGWFFPVLFLVPSIHGVVAMHMKREDRKHRDIVEAIERQRPAAGVGPLAYPSFFSASLLVVMPGLSSSALRKSMTALSRRPSFT